MKLLIGPGLSDPKGDEAFLVKALRKVADVKTFDSGIKDFEQLVRSVPHGWTPDAIVIRDAEYYKMPSGLERAELPIFGLIGDYNLSYNQMLPVLGCFDHFFCDSKGVRIFKKLGFNNCEFFCLYGFDPEVHHPYPSKKEWDVVFIGNLNAAVQQDREEYLYQLATLSGNYRIHIDTLIFGSEYASMLSKSHLVFNRSIRDEVNMRFFEAIGCGSVVMNNHLSELDELGLVPDQHYLVFDDVQATVVRYFKEWSAAERDRIRENAKQVMHEHTYDRRAQDLVKKIQTTRIDISKRRFAGLAEKERKKRWIRYRCDEVDVPGLGRWHRYDPTMVGWQKHLTRNELEIRSLDFNMWFWWMDLLAASGLHSYLAQFMMERQSLLSSFGCYRDVANTLRERLNILLYGFTA